MTMVPADDPRTDAELIKEFAPMINLDLGTARRYVADIRRAAQADGADTGANLDVVTAQDSAHETDATDVLVGVAA